MLRLIIIGVFVNTAFAYTPSLQSLLRNSPNKDLGQSSVLANVKITKIDKKVVEEILGDESIENVFSFRFYNSGGKFSKFLQKNYIGKDYNAQTLTNVHYIKSFSLKAIGATSIEKDFFYAVMGIFLLNSEDLFLEFSQRQGISLPTNRDIKNNDQLSLLNNYIKRLESSDADLNLIPSHIEGEKKEEYKKILTDSYLRTQGTLERVKENNNFYWIYSKNNLTIKIDAIKHEITQIKINTAVGLLSVTARKFEDISGGFIFPAYLRFDLGDSYSYTVKLDKIILYDDTGSKFTSALERSLKELEESTSNKSMILNRLTI